MSDALAARGIDIFPGWNPANLDRLHPGALIVVGNVCRRENPEARRAADLGFELISMPGAIERLLLPGRRSLVVAGTHGKTTTTALLGSTLVDAGLDPTVLVGGVVPDLDGSARLGAGPHFVVEGDEYDSAFFEKTPKFWRYRPWAAIVGSVEHDHLDIYPDEASYLRAFEGLIDRIDPGGLLVLWAADPHTAHLAARAPCRTLTFALASDPGSRTADVVATVDRPSHRGRRLQLRVRWPDGRASRYPTALAGDHNARNAVAAAVVAREAAGLTDDLISRGFARFRGVALRQQHVGTRRAVRVYRDFAHHPEAVRQTLRALRSLASPGRLVAAYEPRSATACRRLHQEAYVEAFAEADLVVFAPVGRPEIPPADRLDTGRIARDLRARGVTALAAASLDGVITALARRARPGDLVALLSNGHFGHADRLLLDRLGGAR
jgi:UDP-N-acetylmuramate: L-alanyl-gamma-D-glutamyl-meso-diaminopimelate ligase